MSKDFNIDEVFEKAERIERNGAAFYHKAAGNTELITAKGLFLKLAAMEEEHERTFNRLRAKFVSKEWQYEVYQPDSEVELYLRAIADGYVFTVDKNPADTLTGRETVGEVLRIAIRAEEDSIIFYLGLKDLVTEEKGGKYIDNIIKEERGHIVLLCRELASL